jgi:hypothetical protein
MSRSTSFLISWRKKRDKNRRYDQEHNCRLIYRSMVRRSPSKHRCVRLPEVTGADENHFFTSITKSSRSWQWLAWLKQMTFSFSTLLLTPKQLQETSHIKQNKHDINHGNDQCLVAFFLKAVSRTCNPSPSGYTTQLDCQVYWEHDLPSWTSHPVAPCSRTIQVNIDRLVVWRRGVLKYTCLHHRYRPWSWHSINVGCK